MLVGWTASGSSSIYPCNSSVKWVHSRFGSSFCRTIFIFRNCSLHFGETVFFLLGDSLSHFGRLSLSFSEDCLLNFGDCLLYFGVLSCPSHFGWLFFAFYGTILLIGVWRSSASSVWVWQRYWKISAASFWCCERWIIFCRVLVITGSRASEVV